MRVAIIVDCAQTDRTARRELGRASGRILLISDKNIGFLGNRDSTVSGRFDEGDSANRIL